MFLFYWYLNCIVLLFILSIPKQTSKIISFEDNKADLILYMFNVGLMKCVMRRVVMRRRKKSVSVTISEKKGTVLVT